MWDSGLGQTKISSMSDHDNVIVHLGTNDIETQSPEEVHANLVHLKCELEDTLQCKVLLSTLLPRNDNLHEATVVCNELLSATSPDDIIRHSQISKSHLHDKKHLSFRQDGNTLSGVQLFAQNLFQAVHSSSPPTLSSAIKVAKNVSHRTSSRSFRGARRQHQPPRQHSRAPDRVSNIPNDASQQPLPTRNRSSAPNHMSTAPNLLSSAPNNTFFNNNMLHPPFNNNLLHPPFQPFIPSASSFSNNAWLPQPSLAHVF